VGGSVFAKPANGAARLIVRRVADLGNFLVIHLSVDGVPVALIGYGRSYEGLLTPGRHVLSLLPTPNPKWPTPWQMTLDARSRPDKQLHRNRKFRIFDFESTGRARTSAWPVAKQTGPSNALTPRFQRRKKRVFRPVGRNFLIDQQRRPEASFSGPTVSGAVAMFRRSALERDHYAAALRRIESSIDRSQTRVPSGARRRSVHGISF